MTVWILTSSGTFLGVFKDEITARRKHEEYYMGGWNGLVLQEHEVV